MPDRYSWIQAASRLLRLMTFDGSQSNNFVPNTNYKFRNDREHRKCNPKAISSSSCKINKNETNEILDYETVPDSSFTKTQPFIGLNERVDFSMNELFMPSSAQGGRINQKLGKSTAGRRFRSIDERNILW